MAQIVSHLTQSKYYSPAFNAAVFDGPIRIYFAQHQETLALKVYFRLQNKMKDLYDLARQNFKHSGQTLFVMLYPTPDTFDRAFPNQKLETITVEDLGEDHVLGVRGPLEDDAYDPLFQRVEELLRRTYPLPQERERIAEL